jgi:hypothetical protein
VQLLYINWLLAHSEAGKAVLKKFFDSVSTCLVGHGSVEKDHPVLPGRAQVDVHFKVYTVASFAAGEFDVEIPYETLRPYLRPGAPVP